MACATHKGHVKNVRFSRAILKGENINLFDRFQVSGGVFFLVVVFLGSGSLPTDLDQGATLLVNATLKFVETARLDGKLSVRAMNALQGPCLAFKSDAFVVASAELHFTNCHNIGHPLRPKDDIPDEEEEEDDDSWRLFDDDEEEEEQEDSGDLMQISALDAEAAEVADGGAMNVHGSLMVMGTLIIRDCGTKHGKGGSLGSNMVACLQDLMMEGPKGLICGFALLSFGMPLVLRNRLLGGRVAGFSLLLPPSLRCDCREAGFFPQRKHLHHQFFGSR